MKNSKLARNIWLGIENLLMHKLRSSLTILGVVFGVGSVVAMLSVGEGASKEAMEQIQKLGSNNIIISAVKALDDTSATNQRIRMSIYGLTFEDSQRIRDTFEHVDQVVGAKILRKDTRVGERSLELRVVGTSSRWFELVPRDVLAGRVFNGVDEESTSPVAVLTEYGARKLLATESTVGTTVNIGGYFFKIIGIIRSESGKAGNMQIPDQEVDVYVPLEVARDYYGDIWAKMTSGSRETEMVQLHQIIVRVDEAENVEKVAAGIDRMLAKFHRKKDYEVSVPLALLKEAQATKRRFNIVLGSIAGISLLVGGIGIMNIMLASVTERTREIGIRRAIGAKRRQIIFQFLIETVVLSTIGGLIGVGVGIFIPVMITYFAGMPTVITMQSIVLPLVISVGVGLVFGLYPAASAARVDPIVALRHE